MTYRKKSKLERKIQRFLYVSHSYSIEKTVMATIIVSMLALMLAGR
jgi:hypothetical protein